MQKIIALGSGCAECLLVEALVLQTVADLAVQAAVIKLKEDKSFGQSYRNKPMFF